MALQPAAARLPMLRNPLRDEGLGQALLLLTRVATFCTSSS
jgi:hypothetical protein